MEAYVKPFPDLNRLFVKIKNLESEDQADFILKSEKAVDNLIFLYSKYREEKDFIKSIKLLDFYQKQKKYRSIFLWKTVFKLFKNLMKENK